MYFDVKFMWNIFENSVRKFVVSDDDNSDNEEVKKAEACEEIVPEVIEKQLTPDELFKDIQEVKDKLKEVRQLLDPTSRVRYSASEGFLQESVKYSS